ncbi:MAG: lysophospholipid acyltransferase family protein [Candidatus Omnitrophica bacterium]|nr:lysophospholipid acyltransferase family protein [Candidatus Omnitrophota bacterium]
MKKKAKKKFISWFTVFGLRFLMFVIRILPLKILYSFGSALSALYYRLAYKNRQTALSNIEKALGSRVSLKQRRMIVQESFKTMGHIILDTLRFGDLSYGKTKKTISIEGIENLQNALKKGKGVIAASAHLGSFTIIGAGLAVRGYKTSFVARHARNKGVERVIMGISRKAGQKVIFSRPVHACMRLCMKTLDRNEVLIIELDQNFGTEGVKISFFDQPAMVASGPIKLALSTQAAIVPIFIVRINAFEHVIKIEPEIELEKYEDADIQIRENLQKVSAVIESYIRKYPGQWVNWIHKQWDVC